MIANAGVLAIGGDRRKHPAGHAKDQREMPGLLAGTHLCSISKGQRANAGGNHHACQRCHCCAAGGKTDPAGAPGNECGEG